MMLSAPSEMSELPIIVQARRGEPVFRGVGDRGQGVLCSSCDDVVLLENVSPDAVFDLSIQCAQCAGVLRVLSRPPGRGLGGVLRVVKRDPPCGRNVRDGHG